MSNKLYKAVLPALSKYIEICDKQSQQINSSIYLHSILQGKKEDQLKWVLNSFYKPIIFLILATF